MKNWIFTDSQQFSMYPRHSITFVDFSNIYFQISADCCYSILWNTDWYHTIMNIIVCWGQCLSSQNQDTEIISVFSTRVIKKVFLNEIINNLLAYYELSDRLEVIGLELSRFEIACFRFSSPWSPIKLICCCDDISSCKSHVHKHWNEHYPMLDKDFAMVLSSLNTHGLKFPWLT